MFSGFFAEVPALLYARLAKQAPRPWPLLQAANVPRGCAITSNHSHFPLATWTV